MTTTIAQSVKPSSTRWILLMSLVTFGGTAFAVLPIEEKVRSIASIAYAVVAVIVVANYFAFRRRFFIANPDSSEIRCPWEKPAALTKRTAFSGRLVFLLIVAGVLGFLTAILKK